MGVSRQRRGWILSLMTLCLISIVGLISFRACADKNDKTRLQRNTKDCVIILHGLGRTSRSMKKLEEFLKKKEYLTWNRTYPSREFSIEELSDHVQKGLDFCKSKNSKSVFFVTHSLGGILVRYYLQEVDNPKIKAIVMLAPPNKGSEVVTAFRDQTWFKWFSGLAGQQLGLEKDSLPNQLSPIGYNIGIIAGTSSSDPWFSYLFSTPNDGKVSVKSTKLNEMRDFMTVEKGHTFIMNDKLVMENIDYFFRNLEFKK